MEKLALALLTLAVALPATAQQSADRPKLGFGVAIFPLQPGSPTVEVYAPMTVAPNFRIEPSIGIYTSNEPAGGVDTRDLTLGIGAFVMKRLSPVVDMYMGGRLKLNFAKVDLGPVDDSGTDIVLAGAVGGEAYLAPRFSLGLEAQLGFYQNSDVSGDDSGLYTTGLAFLRLYL